MNYYININFGKSNKCYFFGTDDNTIKIGDFVVVQTVVGVEIGEVMTYPNLLSNLKFNKEIKPILRKATDADIEQMKTNEILAKSASEFFDESIKKLNLDMRLLSSQYTLDRAKILFTYSADERIDFRELLKVLAERLKCRIELKQVNARERSQYIGGIGVCGLPLCCSVFLTQFDGVTLAKAKNQMLSINIPKLSGQCGKLMCCLKFEDDLYTDLKKDFPEINTTIHYNGADFKVASYNVISKVVKIANENDSEFLPLDKINELLGRSTSAPSKPNFSKAKDNNEIFVKKENPQNKPVKQANNFNQKDNRKPVQQPAKNSKNPAKPQPNSKNNENSQQFFAGQAAKVEQYQKTYFKNNSSKKDSNSEDLKVKKNHFFSNKKSKENNDKK